MNALSASFAAANLVRYLSMSARRELDQAPVGWEMEKALEELTEICNLLGFDLTKRPEPVAIAPEPTSEAA